MWHQLPHAWKRKPDALHDRAAAACRRRALLPDRRTSRAGRRRWAPAAGGRLPGTTSVRRSVAGWRRLTSTCSTSPTPTTWSLSTLAATAMRSGGGPRTLPGCTAEAVRHPSFWHERDGQWQWRGMFESVPLPASWPVYVTWAEAHAYATWRGMRLPTEAEFHRAAYGTPDGHERRYPWGDAVGTRPPANFDFLRWDPEPVDAHPDGASAFGVRDLVGNGWEWTSTVFAPFEGFEALPSYPEYSAEFFDGDHFVMKGASPVTARTLVRPGFRNWFRPRYPYVYAKFRCVKEACGDDRFDGRSSASTCSGRRGSCRRDTSTTSSARRSSKPSAGCRGIASRARRRRCWPRTRATILASADAARRSRGARMRQRREAGGVRDERGGAVFARAVGRHLAGGARDGHLPACGHRHSIRAQRISAPYEDGLAQAVRQRHPHRIAGGALPRIQHRQLRSGRRS